MSRLRFELEGKSPGSKARATTFHTLHNKVQTPVFMPVGTQASIRGQTREYVAPSGSQVLLANTFHLMLRPGADVFKRCAVCHTTEKGGGDGLGPNLSGVMGRKSATRPGYAYSAPLKKAGLIWNEANLNKWVAGPQRLVPGNKMMFPGLSSKKQQADVVAFLGTLK